MQTEQGVCYDRRFISHTYLRGWFLIDCPSSIPIDLFMEWMTREDADPNAGSENSSGALRMLKMIRLARFMKLIRLMKAAKIFRVLEEELDLNMSLLKLAKLFFVSGAVFEQGWGGKWVLR